MRKYSLLLLAIVAFAWLVPACAGSADVVKARLGEEFSLRMGETARIAQEDLTIRFDEVVEDSRCPRNVACVWEGRVSCVVELADGDASHKMVLTEPGLTDQYAEATYGQYQLVFHVEPYPEEAGEIQMNEYQLLLIVSR